MILLIQKLHGEIHRLKEKLENEKLTPEARVRIKLLITNKENELYNLTPRHI